MIKYIISLFLLLFGLISFSENKAMSEPPKELVWTEVSSFQKLSLPDKNTTYKDSIIKIEKRTIHIDTSGEWKRQAYLTEKFTYGHENVTKAIIIDSIKFYKKEKVKFETFKEDFVVDSIDLGKVFTFVKYSTLKDSIVSETNLTENEINRLKQHYLFNFTQNIYSPQTKWDTVNTISKIFLNSRRKNNIQVGKEPENKDTNTSQRDNTKRTTAKSKNKYSENSKPDKKICSKKKLSAEENKQFHVKLKKEIWEKDTSGHWKKEVFLNEERTYTPNKIKKTLSIDSVKYYKYENNLLTLIEIRDTLLWENTLFSDTTLSNRQMTLLKENFRLNNRVWYNHYFYFGINWFPSVSYRYAVINDGQLQDNSVLNDRNINDKPLLNGRSGSLQIGYTYKRKHTFLLEAFKIYQKVKTYNRVNLSTGLPIENTSSTFYKSSRNWAFGIGYRYSGYGHRFNLVYDAGLLFGTNYNSKGIFSLKMGLGLNYRPITCWEVRVVPTWIQDLSSERNAKTLTSYFYNIGINVGVGIYMRWW